MQNVLEEAPVLQSSVATTPQMTGSKAEMVADFKKRTESVFDQVREASDRFREVKRIDALPALPESVATNVRSLAEQATDLRGRFGYQVEFYECGVETATVAGLVAVDQATLLFAQKNAPQARLRLTGFFSRYPEPTRDNQKPLWRYNRSILMSLEKAKTEAENHLQRAKGFETAGKKAEALREYREIYRIYPNPITGDKIKLLEAAPH